MEASSISLKYNLPAVKLEVHKAVFEFMQRGLIHTSEWLADLNCALNHVKFDIIPPLGFNRLPRIKKSEQDVYRLAYSYFMLQQYGRCASVVGKLKSKPSMFLKYYALFLDLEIHRITGITDENIFEPMVNNTRYTDGITDLYHQMREEYLCGNFDGYILYVYGLVLKRMRLFDNARSVFVEAINALPINWSSWSELSSLTSDKELLESYKLPNHWLKDFFVADTFCEVHLNNDALIIYKMLLDNGFHKFNYLLIQKARCLYHLKDMQGAYDEFMKVRNNDALRFDGMSTLSRILVLTKREDAKLNDCDERRELSKLARAATEYDSCHFETSAIIGNYYSSRKEHTRAIDYFKMAIRVNPFVNTTWTLLGVEYLHLKNTSAASLSFRKAIECKQNDPLALLGLSQTCEIQRSLPFALYYIRRAFEIYPTNAKYLMWMAGLFERMARIGDAIACYNAVQLMSKPDPLCLVQLAKLCSSNHMQAEAVKVHEKIVSEKLAPYSTKYPREYVVSCQYLSRYYESRKDAQKSAYYSELARKIPPSG